MGRANERARHEGGAGDDADPLDARAPPDAVRHATCSDPPESRRLRKATPFAGPESGHLRDDA